MNNDLHSLRNVFLFIVTIFAGLFVVVVGGLICVAFYLIEFLINKTKCIDMTSFMKCSRDIQLMDSFKRKADLRIEHKKYN